MAWRRRRWLFPWRCPPAPPPCVAATAAALLVVAAAFYYSGSAGEALRSGTPPSGPAASASSAWAPAEGEPGAWGARGAGWAPELHVLMALTRAEGQPGLRAKAEAALRSLARRAKLGPRQALVLHLLTDAPSRGPAKALLRDSLRDAPLQHKVVLHDVEALAAKLLPVVEEMREVFSAGAGAYYAEAIFFLSVALHRLLPDEISRIVQVDLDVEYRANIRELFEEFDNFPEGAVIGIAREMQPVYRHIFWQYRREHPGTRVGDPPPEGLPGFNSGVLLLDLEAMRHSELYNRLLEAGAIRRLAEKFHFRGHLGDQDFFTLVGMEHPELFHLLDCTWNRQLCIWWRDHGYSDIFEQYFRCEGHVKIYHGNCNTPIPQE